MIQTPTEIGAPYRGVLGLTQFGRVASVGWPLKRPRLAAGGKQIRTLGPPSPAQTVLRVSESDAVVNRIIQRFERPWCHVTNPSHLLKMIVSSKLSVSVATLGAPPAER